MIYLSQFGRNVLPFVAAIISLTSAGKITGKRVTGCYRANTLRIQVLDLVNPGSPSASEVFSPVYDVTPCATVDSEVLTNHKEYVRTATTPIPFFGCDLTSEKFCCIQIEEIANPADPLYADVPYLNFGDGHKKYHITGVRCKP